MESSRQAIESAQLSRLNQLLALVHGKRNEFQQSRVPKEVISLEEFKRTTPLTTKQELVADRERFPPFGTNLTFPLDNYTRYCQTSGTSGEPMPWLDTQASWQALLDGWKRVHQAAGLTSPNERVFFAFSFGPFLGFWTAFEAAVQLGFLAIPGGGMRSEARLRTMKRCAATALCCTPTYAIRLGEMAQAERLHLPDLKVIMVAGEPGGSIAEVRERIGRVWGGEIRVFDHHGLTETGPVTHGHPDEPGNLVVMEDDFIAEILDPETGQEVEEGETGELILTTLHRHACPLFRYRTGDLVRKRFLPEMALEGGILSRVDDMVLVRGVNVYPSAVEALVRRFAEVQEYRVYQTTRDAMTELRITVEGDGVDARICERLQALLWDQFQLRIPVEVVPMGTLPQFELKANRWERC